MKSALIFVMIIAVGLASDEEKVAEKEVKRSLAACNVQGYQVGHGQIFSIPGTSKCIKYMCTNGFYNILHEGCEVNHQCHNVGALFRSSCTAYRCIKSRLNSGHFLYQPTPVHVQCPDLRGVCRNLGDRFPYILNQRLYRDCTCSLYNNNIHYTCR